MAVVSFKCPNCDGELIFDPSTQKYKCEYCFSLFSQEELDAMKPAQTTEPQNADAAGAGKASGKPENKKRGQPGDKAGSGTEKDNTENKESDKEAGKEADLYLSELWCTDCDGCHYSGDFLLLLP